MTLLDNHLEQISLSSATIAELLFPPPKIFTNSLLGSHDITALIRDTEPHERVLFTSANSDQGVRPSTAKALSHNTLNHSNGFGETYSTKLGFKDPQKKSSAVATLLGGELGEKIRKESSKDGKERGELDVDLLLQGAEKLCGVYPIPGAPERIAALRSRSEQLKSSIARYESKVAKQMIQLEKMNKHKDSDGGYDDTMEEDSEVDGNDDEAAQSMRVTEEDLIKEDEVIRELEKKKRTLEDRVSGMERDLGGLRR